MGINRKDWDLRLTCLLVLAGVTAASACGAETSTPTAARASVGAGATFALETVPEDLELDPTGEPMVMGIQTTSLAEQSSAQTQGKEPPTSEVLPPIKAVQTQTYASADGQPRLVVAAFDMRTYPELEGARDLMPPNTKMGDRDVVVHRNEKGAVVQWIDGPFYVRIVSLGVSDVDLDRVVAGLSVAS